MEFEKNMLYIALEKLEEMGDQSDKPEAIFRCMGVN